MRILTEPPLGLDPPKQKPADDRRSSWRCRARWRGANLTASALDRVWSRHGLLQRACVNLGPAANGACSSDGQSSGFLNRVSGVRVSPGPPLLLPLARPEKG